MSPMTETEGRLTKVYIVYYSMYGYIHHMAKAVKKGVDSVPGCKGVLYQVGETLPEEVLQKMRVKKSVDVPVIGPKDLTDADGILFGFPISFGTIPAQMKSFLEAMSLHWQSGGLLGKPSGMFTSSGISESGLQAILISIVAYMVHNGMIFVPVGTTYEPDWFGERAVKLDPLNESGTINGSPGFRLPDEGELRQAQFQGSYFAVKAKLLCHK